MATLHEHAKSSDIMKMAVEYNNKKFSWDMFEELKIVETKLNSHVKTQTTSYAFLAMLHVKLKIKARDQAKHVKRMKDKYLADFRGKYKTVTEAEAVMYSKHKDLKQEEDKLLQIEEIRDLLEVCVRSFESRKDMLQSLSANIRNEK